MKCSKMTVTPKISVNDGKLVVHGKTILTGVPDNVVLTPGSGRGLVTGAFVGATASHSKSLHVFPMGVLEYVFLTFFTFTCPHLYISCSIVVETSEIALNYNL